MLLYICPLVDTGVAQGVAQFENIVDLLVLCVIINSKADDEYVIRPENALLCS